MPSPQEYYMYHVNIAKFRKRRRHFFSFWKAINRNMLWPWTKMSLLKSRILLMVY